MKVIWRCSGRSSLGAWALAARWPCLANSFENRMTFIFRAENALPVILPSLEIMFMRHLGKRISPQFIIDKVYIFNNGIWTSENFTMAPLALHSWFPIHPRWLTQWLYMSWTKHKTWTQSWQTKGQVLSGSRIPGSLKLWEPDVWVTSVKQDGHMAHSL